MKHSPSKEVRRSSGVYVQTCIGCKATRLIVYSLRSHKVHPWYTDDIRTIRQPICTPATVAQAEGRTA